MSFSIVEMYNLHFKLYFIFTCAIFYRMYPLNTLTLAIKNYTSINTSYVSMPNFNTSPIFMNLMRFSTYIFALKKSNMFNHVSNNYSKNTCLMKNEYFSFKTINSVTI